MHDDDVDEEESMHMVMRSCSFMDMIPPMTLTSLGPDESLLFGDKVELLLFIFNLFFSVEFQKFLISLSVRPGRRAAI